MSEICFTELDGMINGFRLTLDTRSIIFNNGEDREVRVLEDDNSLIFTSDACVYDDVYNKASNRQMDSFKTEGKKGLPYFSEAKVNASEVSNIYCDFIRRNGHRLSAMYMTRESKQDNHKEATLILTKDANSVLNYLNEAKYYQTTPYQDSKVEVCLNNDILFRDDNVEVNRLGARINKELQYQNKLEESSLTNVFKRLFGKSNKDEMEK